MNIFPRKEIDELKDNRKTLKFQITDFFIPESDKNIKDFDGKNHHCARYIATIRSQTICICISIIL
jgi:hypothetical protein